MKIHKKQKLIGAAITVAYLSSFGTSVFADNPYGIVYSGGEPLSESNVNIDPTLIDGLQPLIKDSSSNTVVFEDASKWQTVYDIIDGQCTLSNYKYVGISRNNSINKNSGLNYTIHGGDYDLKVELDGVYIEGYDDVLQDNQVLALAVHSRSGAIATTSRDYYLDSTCTNKVSNLVPIHGASGGHIYFQVNLKPYRKGSNEVFAPEGLYLGITDIDAAQSYKILNDENKLSPSNMYASSAESIQPQDSTQRNMYLASGNYIYSPYEPAFDIPSGANLYVSVKPEVQKDGLDLVFGFTGGAASGLEYYAKQFTVTYDSDDNGSITGIKEEKVVAGDVPSGSESEPKEGYELDYWVADKDVTLKDGTTIEAGEELTLEQLKEVIVNQDIKFTAIHKIIEPEEESSDIKVPDTGSSTDNGSGLEQTTIYILGSLMVIPLSYIVALLCRKKVNFDK